LDVCQIQKENPDAGFGALSTLLGEKWKGVSAEEKKPYEEKAAALKGVYTAEMEAYKKVCHVIADLC
jgi:hypothetical protein